MSTASQTQEKKFGDDTGLLHQVALSLRAVCKDESEARAVATKLAHDRPFLTKVVNLAIGKPKRGRSTKGLINSDLLEPVTTVSVGEIEAFSAKQMMSVGAYEGVKIYWNGDNFKKHFLELNKTGKNELNVPAQKLRVHKLRKGSVDGPILAELGGETAVETNLATMFELMKKQGNGQAGDLLINGYANIFYIRDDNDVLWAVCCDWHAGGGWGVGANALSNPFGWRAGGQVFSR